MSGGDAGATNGGGNTVAKTISKIADFSLFGRAVKGIYNTVQDNKNGILVEPDNPKQLADAITKLLFDDPLRVRLGLFGYNFVHEECNSISMAKNSLKLYEELLKINHNK